METVNPCKYLRLWLDNKLVRSPPPVGEDIDWLDFLRRLRTFNIMFYQWVAVGRQHIQEGHIQTEKPIRWAGSVVGVKMRTLNKLMDDASHPVHTVLSHQRSLLSHSLLLPQVSDQQSLELPCPSDHRDGRLLTRGEEDTEDTKGLLLSFAKAAGN